MLRLARVILAASIFGLTFLAAADAEEGRSLRFGVPDVPPGLGNPYTALIPPSTIYWSAIFDGLTRLEEDGTLAPALATSWELVEPTKWRFHLREGVTFSNGEPFDAAAVVAALAYAKTDDAKTTPLANELKVIKQAIAVDPLTVVIETEKPDALLPNRMVVALIVAPKAWADMGPTAFANAPVGTGAFVLDTWGGASRRVVIRPRPDSWRWEGRAPNLDRVEFVQLTDAPSRVQALLSGQIDITFAGPDDVDTLKAAGFNLRTGPAPQVVSLAFITTYRDSPLDNKDVRQALNYAVNKDAIAQGILHGLVRPMGQPAAPGVFGYNPTVTAYPYDPVKAKALLAQAGYADGFAITAEVNIGAGVPGDALVYQAVKQDLAAVGVALTLQPTVFPDWFGKYLAGTFEGEAFSLGYNSIPYNDVMRPMENYSCLKNNPFFCDEAIAAKLKVAASEMDPAKRLALLQQLAVDYHDAAPGIFLFQQTELMAYAANIGGLKLVNRVPSYERITFAK